MADFDALRSAMHDIAAQRPGLKIKPDLRPATDLAHDGLDVCERLTAGLVRLTNGVDGPPATAAQIDQALAAAGRSPDDRQRIEAKISEHGGAGRGSSGPAVPGDNRGHRPAAENPVGDGRRAGRREDASLHAPIDACMVSVGFVILGIALTLATEGAGSEVGGEMSFHGGIGIEDECDWGSN